MLNTQRTPKPDATAPAVPRPAAVQLRARRSPKLIALGVLLVTMGGLGAAFLFTLNTDHQAVLALTDDVRRGDTIGREQIAVVEVPAAAGMNAMPADRIDELVGQQALFDLPEGTFPLARHVGDDPLPEGQALVGLRLTPGRMPIGELPPGTFVRLVSLAEGDETVAEAVIAAAPVVLEEGTYAIDVRLLDGEADAIAKLSAADALALVVHEEG